ncbi:hypothetical protein HMPREF9336_04367 [Segniliparus rugosus ATCC BAA-974]|uniref:Uncharacterized protein n=1 Tax=Segniliparus rugosus (strain ATCC BAA-974 / DSM 45345 / CCUG 50838 / CIP 108380 / JCM 13579 / CDC 945) TaxID=679197 RepID=U1N8R3_SEGRC|nr:hypothetical protein HMPREF9336_04367 [Segniliparus rugosus ATCC BAA-974]
MTGVGHGLAVTVGDAGLTTPLANVDQPVPLTWMNASKY